MSHLPPSRLASILKAELKDTLVVASEEGLSSDEINTILEEILAERLRSVFKVLD